jgi:purine-nucleoside phosphorylase
MDQKSAIAESVRYIRTLSDKNWPLGIILGTGLGTLADEIDVKLEISYDKIPNFPVSTVESHSGKLLFGSLGGKEVAAMQGRFHYYEGYNLKQVTFPVRVLKELGIKILIVSNAAGGVNPQYKTGDLVMITDHINFQGANPLIGSNDDGLGDEKIPLQKGVYVSVTGPNLETSAEYRMVRILGGDLVGMSTVPEVIVARHQGNKVLGFSIVTDMGLPDAPEPCTIESVLAAAAVAEPKMTRLVKKTIERMKI